MLLQRSFKGVSDKFQGSLFKNVSGKFPMFRGSFIEVSREFKKCFKRVARVFQDSFKCIGIGLVTSQVSVLV